MCSGGEEDHPGQGADRDNAERLEHGVLGVAGPVDRTTNCGRLDPSPASATAPRKASRCSATT
jgi:hypothetical protein